MADSSKIENKNILINNMLAFKAKAVLLRITLKVKELKERVIVNTLAQKELFTFSGDNWVHGSRKPIKYINLVQCCFLHKVKVSSDPNILRSLNVVFGAICFRVIFDSNNRKQYNCLVLANSKITKNPYFYSANSGNYWKFEAITYVLRCYTSVKSTLNITQLLTNLFLKSKNSYFFAIKLSRGLKHE